MAVKNWSLTKFPIGTGVLTRVAAKVAAFNLGVYLNHLFARPTFAFFDPFE